ncbi:long chronological lifespan protein 2 [Gymnopilus junonius]|uniref:Long chronological lifespan protein 2 n=1 Tax=Gymnopilus junonius TaxID=109634 RepID=A0A9P5P1A2_GYMJU|nr:long chronological lifespan protein 2 [Gymnopilus junonius]
MQRSFLRTFLFLAGLNYVSAQFNFFENMFGHQQHHQQQHRSAASQWAAYSDSVSCSQYLCPETLDCVAKPVDCPCPNPEDIRCIVPDTEVDVEGATVMCTRGHNDCTEVEKLMKRGVKPKKK